jgi:hypothetical protein
VQHLSEPTSIKVGFFDSTRKEVTMLKVHILTNSSHYNGEAYQPISEGEAAEQIDDLVSPTEVKLNDQSQ